MVTSVQPVQAKRVKSQAQLGNFDSTPHSSHHTWSSKSPPGLDISCLLLCQGPHTFSLPIELPTSAQFPDGLQHLSLCPLKTLCPLGAKIHSILTQTVSHPTLEVPLHHPPRHTFLSTCSLALLPVPPARSRYLSEAWSRVWPPATVASRRQRQAPNTVLLLPREGMC